MATELVKWTPSLNPPEGPGKFRNTFRMMLQLEAGDFLDLASVIDGAENIKSAYVWRTKDGWELRVASYSGTYGLSVEAEELKEDHSIFDKVLASCDIEPPFKDDKKCQCGCGSPSKVAFLPDHRLRNQSEPMRVPPPVEEPVAPEPVEEVPQDEPQEVEAPEPEVAVEQQGEEIEPSDEPEDTAPDATLPPEPAAAAEPQKSNEYAKYLIEKMLPAPEDSEETGEPKDDEFLSQRRVDTAIDAMLQPEYTLTGDDVVAARVAAIGIRDPYIDEVAFVGRHQCGCGCGSPVESRGSYLPLHDVRHREWLLSRAKHGDKQAYVALRTLGWLTYLSDGASSDYDPSRVPAGLPIGSDAYEHFEMLDPGAGSLETKIGRLVARRDKAESAVLRALLNEAIYRLRRGMDNLVDVRPSNNRRAVVDLAFRLAAAESGILFEATVDWEEASPESQKSLQEAWANRIRRDRFMEEAERMLDTAGTDESLIEIAGRMTVYVMRRAISAGVEEAPYEYQVLWPEGNPTFDPSKVESGEDDERFSPVKEPVYSKYRDWMEFSGEPFDPKAKFYNYLAMDVAAGNKPSWVTGESDDPWLAAAQFDTEDEGFVEYWSQWWLAHGYKAAVYSPDSAFILPAKNARDYAYTNTLDSDAVMFDRLHDVAMSPQAIGSFLEGYLLSSPTNRGRAVFVSGSPLENDYFMVARRGAAGVVVGQDPSRRLEGWARVRKADRARVCQVMLDAGAMVKPASWDGAGIPDQPSWADPMLDKAREGLSLLLPLGDGREVEFVPDLAHKPSGLKDDVWSAVRSERGMLRFHKMTPTRIARWLRDTFGASVEPVVPAGYFYPNGRTEGVPNIPQDEYADGSVRPEFDEFGIVRSLADLTDLLNVAAHGGVVSTADAMRRGENVGSSAKGDIGSGLDDYVICGFTDVGGQAFLGRSVGLLVFRSDLAMNHGLLFAPRDMGGSKDRFTKYDSYMRGFGGQFGQSLPVQAVCSMDRLRNLDGDSAEVGFPGEVNVEDLVAVVVPASWVEDKQAVEALRSIEVMNPAVEIHYTDDVYNLQREVAADVISRYNRMRGFAEVDNVGLQRGDVVAVAMVTDDDTSRFNTFVMDVNRVDGGKAFGKLHSTPATENWLSAGTRAATRDGKAWVQSALAAEILGEDSRPREVEIDRDHIVWLSKKLES